MILLDASVLIDALRTTDPRMHGVFVSAGAAICGVTRAEILHGARDEKHFRELAASLAAFPQVPIPETTWDLVGERLYALRTAGITVPLGDAIVAVVAIENNLELWARDAHFPIIQKVLPQLKLFPEPLSV
jgi:predicted nucleic acid-binding protein